MSAARPSEAPLLVPAAAVAAAAAPVDEDEPDGWTRLRSLELDSDQRVLKS